MFGEESAGDRGQDGHGTSRRRCSGRQQRVTSAATTGAAPRRHFKKAASRARENMLGIDPDR